MPATANDNIPSKPMKTIVCAVCGVSTKRNSPIQKYCAPCSRVQKFKQIGIAKKRRLIAKKIRLGPTVIQCAECSSVFEKMGSNHLRCERCSKEASKESARRRASERRKDESFRALEAEYRKSKSALVSRKKAQDKFRSKDSWRIQNAVRQGVRKGILSGAKCGRKTFDLLGYSPDEMRSHLESKFLPGMTWENYGEWHIDHIMPLSAHNYFSPDDIDFKRCWGLSNLQPLWAQDNIRKSAKLPHPFQPSFAFGGIRAVG